MARFALFAGSKHYPRGGWRDFFGSFMTLEDALDSVKRLKMKPSRRLHYPQWWHIIDLWEGRRVRWNGWYR